MKRLREKFPEGLLIQVRFVADDGGIVEFEGLDGTVFEKVIKAVRQA